MRPEARRYRLGLRLIESDLPLPELSELGLQEGEHPDAFIRVGHVPGSIPDVVANETRWWASATEYLQRVPGVAAFHVAEGRQITVEPEPDARPGDIRAYLLAPIFSQLCFQAGQYALHASGIRLDSGVVALLGDSGAGKSTLAAALHRRGFPVVADDMCLLDVAPSGIDPIRVIPVVPSLKLWRSAIEQLGDSPEILVPVWSQEDKFRVQVSQTEELSPLRHIVFLEWASDRDTPPRLLPTAPATAMAQLMRLMHFEYLMKATGRLESCFRLCGQILRQAEVHTLLRPRDFAGLDETVEIVHRELSLKP